MPDIIMMPCRAIFWYLWGITSCRIFLSSLDGITHLYRTHFYCIKWLWCHRYCFRICQSHKYTSHTFSLFLLMRYCISLIIGSWLWDVIQSASNMAFGSFCISKVSLTWLLQEYTFIKVVPCGAFEMSAWTLSASICWSWSCYGIWDKGSASTATFPDL